MQLCISDSRTAGWFGGGFFFTSLMLSEIALNRKDLEQFSQVWLKCFTDMCFHFFSHLKSTYLQYQMRNALT